MLHSKRPDHLGKQHKWRSALLAGFLVVLPMATQALYFNPSGADPTGLISDTTGNINAIALGHSSPSVVALLLINVALSLLAALCVALLLYAGFLWLWARGNADEVKKAKDIIIGTVIGLVIVLASLGITQFVFTTIVNITGATVTS
jgi:hypothetical protein